MPSGVYPNVVGTLYREAIGMGIVNGDLIQGKAVADKDRVNHGYDR